MELTARPALKDLSVRKVRWDLRVLLVPPAPLARQAQTELTVR